MKRQSKRIINNPGVVLLLIVLFALFLRMYFFIGFANNDPQDDGIYIGQARRVLNGKFFNFKWAGKLVSSADTINPVYQFPFRWVMIFSLVLSFILFGINDYSAALFPLLCSLASIVVVFYIGKILFNERTGLIASFLLSIFPLNVVYATRITPDVPVAFFMALSALLFIIAEKREKDKGIFNLKNLYFMLSGIFLGIGYLTKASALIIICFFTLYSLYHRRIRKTYILIFIGFLLIYSVEGLYYYIETGDFLLRPHLNSKVYKYKYDVEFKNRFESRNLYGLLKVIYLPDMDMYPRILLNEKPKWRSKSTECFGYFYYFVILSMLSLIPGQVRGKCSKNAHIPILWALSVFLFLEFGPMGFEFNSGDSFIKYLAVSKIPRYLTILTIPSVLIIASFLGSEKRTIKWFLMPVSLIILSVSSIPLIENASMDFISPMEGIKEASEFLDGNPGKRIYTDYLAAGFINYYTGYNKGYKFISFGYPKYQNSFNLSRISGDSFVLIGGSRGAISCKHVIKALDPPFALNPPGDWILVKNISSRIKPCIKNNWNVKIYYVPPR